MTATMRAHVRDRPEYLFAVLGAATGAVPAGIEGAVLGCLGGYFLGKTAWSTAQVFGEKNTG